MFQSLTNTLREQYRTRPLRTVLVAGLFFRLIAAIFSQGFMMSDDHYLVIEVAQGWAEGLDLEHWFVDTYEENRSGRSILYPGLHYLLFSVMDAVGLSSPTFKMLVVRLLHALYSLLVIFFGFKITERISNKQTAAKVGLILALLWMLPVLSVRNLVEMVAIPPLLAGTYWLMTANERKNPWLWILAAGAMMEVAVALRYQTGLYAMGLGAGVLLQRNWKAVLPLALGFLLPFLLIHGWIESYIAGVPFGKVRYYIEYNLLHSNDYINLPAFNYILLVAGVLIPPVGLFVFAGTFKAWKKYLPLFLGTIFFFGFHSYFPNKQERFMFTMIPMFVILGYVGWQELNRSAFWQKRQGFVRGSWKFFWILNGIALALATWQPSKLARIDVMRYMGTKTDLQTYVIDNSARDGEMLLPRFYQGRFPTYYHITKRKPIDDMLRKLRHKEAHEQPNYFIFSQRPNEDLTERIETVRAHFPTITYDTTISGSLLDQLHNKLNPKHAKNDNMVIYKVP